MKSANKIVFTNKVSPLPAEPFGDVLKNDKSTESQLVKRIQELETINIHLENIVEAGTKKLAEVVATNAKYLSIIAHDLRSPFLSILSVMNELKESLDAKNIKETVTYINMATDAAKKTLNLLDNLLPWAIAQSHEKSFSPVKINLYELFVSEIESFNNSANQKQIVLNHTVTRGLNVTADLQMVKTILRNLINNAIKFTGTGGEITLHAKASRPFVEISVKDNGVGISAESQRELFKSDVANSNDGTNNEHGTGLGLLLCKEFVELHGGKIWIVSKPGKGSEFKFTLPRYI